MKAIVEWGQPQFACKGRKCGVSGKFVVDNPTQAHKLAVQLFHTLTKGAEGIVNPKLSLGVSKEEPRKVVWSKDRTAWICVSILDGVPRGDYAAKADKMPDPSPQGCPICGAGWCSRHEKSCSLPGYVGASTPK